MSKFMNMKYLGIFLFFMVVVAIPFVVQAGQDNKNFVDFPCGRHGFNDFKDCGGQWDYFDQSREYISGSIHYEFSGHRHGSSNIRANVCLTTSIGGGECRWFTCSGDSCGFEYGDVHLFTPPYDFGDINISSTLANYMVYRTAAVTDAEVRVVANGYAIYPDQVPGCTDPIATNYNPSASVDDGSCVYDHIVNLNFFVKDQNGQPISGAAVNINQDFGNGTNRMTDGSGFGNFGVLNDRTIGYSVSATNCTDVNSSVWSNEGATANVSLACAGPPPATQVCNNGIKEGTEECDKGSANGSCPASCSSSCTTNNSCVPTGTGTVNITSTNQGAAHYTTFPNGTINGWNGNHTWSSAATGTYSLTADDVPGYTKAISPPSPQTLSSGGTINWNITYSSNPPGSSGPVSASCSVNVSSPTVDIKANGTDGSVSIPWNSSANLSWTSANSGSCTASGDWSGSKPLSGSQGTGNLTVVKTYNYDLSCSGNGSSQDRVQVVVNASAPTTSNVTATEPNYCVSGPAVTMSWAYSDPAGSPQSAYQVQVDNNGGFSSPEIDTGKINSGSSSWFSGQGILVLNTVYRARVRTWNSFDTPSSWQETTICNGSGCIGSNSWKTPQYAYPQVDFNWIVNGIQNNPSPPLDKPVDFTDQTVFQGPVNGRRWDWTFGDGNTSTNQNPSSTYVAEGNYYVTLTATDGQNQTCSSTKGPLIIQKPIPKWREIAPK